MAKVRLLAAFRQGFKFHRAFLTIGTSEPLLPARSWASTSPCSALPPPPRCAPRQDSRAPLPRRPPPLPAPSFVAPPGGRGAAGRGAGLQGGRWALGGGTGCATARARSRPPRPSPRVPSGRARAPEVGKQRPGRAVPGCFPWKEGNGSVQNAFCARRILFCRLAFSRYAEHYAERMV